MQMNLKTQIIESQPKKLSWEDKNEYFDLGFNQLNEKINDQIQKQKDQQLLQNCLQNLNYQELFYKQKQKNTLLQAKIKELQQKISNYQTMFQKSIKNPNFVLENQQISKLIQKNQIKKPFLTKIKLTLLEDIQSFKSVLPNSIKFIDFKSQIMQHFESDYYNEQKKKLKNNPKIAQLIQCFAIFQLKDTPCQQLESNKENSQNLLQSTQKGQLIYCSRNNPHKLIQHSSKLVFPQPYFPKQLNSQRAIQKAKQFFQFNDQYLKSFLLMFQPQTCIFQNPKKYTSASSSYSEELDKNNESLLKLMNQQQRYYAICIDLQDYQHIQFHSESIKKIINPDFDNSLDQDLFDTHMKTQSNQNQLNNFQKQLIHIKKTSIKTTRTVFSIFTKYPFFKQFQDILKAILKVICLNRQALFKQNHNNLIGCDCHLTFQLFQKQVFKIITQYRQKQLILNSTLRLKVTQDCIVLFQFKKFQCEYFYINLWAYPLLSLFTLDTFLDVLTLIMLQQKVIFVCENQHILTYIIFLFVKVLCRPFKYPYPVVSIIPNQFEYFNAPFPIVYGCVKQKRIIKKQKIMTKYKNVYIFVGPEGVQIQSELKLQNILMKKSMRLRDKLMPQFVSMKKNYPKIKNSFSLSNFFGLQKQSINKKKKYDFQSNNIEISISIINSVKQYFTEINNLFPNIKQLQNIKHNLIIQKQKQQAIQTLAKNEDTNEFVNELDRSVYQKAKQIAKKKTKDLFALSLLETQIMRVNVTF